VVSELPVLFTSLMSEEDQPPYGALVLNTARMHFGKVSNCTVMPTNRLTKEIGGNEAFPPLWQEFKVLDDRTRYVVNNLYMGSWNRPLPGV
jgi:hypothetical protein